LPGSSVELKSHFENDLLQLVYNDQMFSDPMKGRLQFYYSCASVKFNV